MAILAALFALGSRFAGQVLTTALGWASTLLFGRVPADRQKLVLGVAFGSIIWLVLIAGIAVPNVGAFLLVLLPAQSLVPQSVIRLVMLVGAIVAPGLVGILVAMLDRANPRTPHLLARAIVRGYLVTALLAVLLVFLALLALWRRLLSLRRGWTDAHVSFVVKQGAYVRVAADLRDAIGQAGLVVDAGTAPASMSRPARWLSQVAGDRHSALVPERMIQLTGPKLDVLIYPMDILISGRPEEVTRARAAIASRLTTSAANLTVTAEAQALEDEVTGLARGASDTSSPPRYDARAKQTLEDLDARLDRAPIPYDEWETVYRQRLQVERDLRARSMAEPGSATGEPSPAPGGLGDRAEAAAVAAFRILKWLVDPAR